MKKLLTVAVLVSAFSQMAQGYEPGPVMPVNRNIGGNPGRQILNTKGGVEQFRPGQNGGGVQKLRPGQNGGGEEILHTKGGVQSLESRRKDLRDLCFRHGKAYIVRKGQVGRCLPSGKSTRAKLNMNNNIQPIMPVTSTASRPGQNGSGTRTMTGNKAGGSF
jgi:hypothetical protein